MRYWRVGIEARIGHLKRGFGFRLTRPRRLAGARIWAGLRRPVIARRVKTSSGAGS